MTDTQTAPKIARFDFQRLRDFAEPLAQKPATVETAPEVIEIAAPPPPPPSFSEAELANARQEGQNAGRQEGILEGIAQAQNEQTRQQEMLQQAVSTLSQQAEALQGEFDRRYNGYKDDVLQLSTAIARQICAMALSQVPSAMVESLIEQSLPILIRQPKITATVHPDIETSTRDVLETLCSRAGYNGTIEIRSAAAMAPHDGQLQWADGSAETVMGDIWQKIEHTLKNTISQGD